MAVFKGISLGHQNTTHTRISNMLPLHHSLFYVQQQHTYFKMFCVPSVCEWFPDVLRMSVVPITTV